MTIAYNAASGNGGGVENLGTLTVIDSTIAGNTASGSGGGIDTSGTVSLQSSTLSFNHAAIAGGLDVESGTTTLRDVIVDGDRATSKDPELAGSFTSPGHNLVGYVNGDVTGLVASDLTGLAPGLGGLAANGGPTPTLALLQDSPAIDAGDRRPGHRPARPAADRSTAHRHRCLRAPGPLPQVRRRRRSLPHQRRPVTHAQRSARPTPRTRL